ncbi:glycoside hydrolase 43 family protein [Rhizobium sp. CSW-27]|uniref:glycoside hydrolase family 43 protein n=1 Tax=Rhizobium sp. CSW-27 TaxID=2839985 RepID=UPI001C01C4E9|nr:glycoside hydrolase 43 family protein [Rhizobium sp. CSW-27]MBT9371132.1 glycoside hydrolase 43 family protein [Rhizobium sp. CSW-27]
MMTAWISDQRDGTYLNPVLNGDYSDVDVVRVGDDYYLTSSSFTNVPGLPILHSRDLVNWTIIGYALSRLVPEAHYLVPRRGGGVWAPTIRHRNDKFMIYYADPDFGTYVVTAIDPTGPWTPPVLVDATKGAIDPAPLWDEDGQGYLVYAFAKSRSGIDNIIALKRLNADGTATVGEEIRIIEAGAFPPVETSQGLMPWFTVEGPKLYKRGRYYYVFAPAGSVKGGWQGVFRSEAIEGPYEGRSVMDQGATEINGPHQGAWVDTPDGNENWFLHFQDTDAYGRRVMLQPMIWDDDGWPLIGERQEGKHYGQPVQSFRKPDLPVHPVAAPVADDDFKDGFHLGWQWSANPASDWFDASIKGKLRLKSVSSSANLWEAGNLLTQKLPGMAFSVTATLSLAPNLEGERAGLLVFGADYGWIGLENTADGVKLVQVTRLKASAGGAETVLSAPLKVAGPVIVRAILEPVTVPQPVPPFPNYWPSMLRATMASVRFCYSTDGETFVPIGSGFLAPPGRWVGVQIGIFAQALIGTPSNVATRVGYAEFERFTIAAV